MLLAGLHHLGMHGGVTRPVTTETLGCAADAINRRALGHCDEMTVLGWGDPGCTLAAGTAPTAV